MEKMVRKQIYIQSEQDQALKEKARELGVSEAELIRAGLDSLFALLKGRGVSAAGKHSLPMVGESPQAVYETAAPPREREAMTGFIDKGLRIRKLRPLENMLAREDMAAWKAEMAFMEERSRMQVGAGVRWTREELYDERL